MFGGSTYEAMGRAAREMLDAKKLTWDFTLSQLLA